MKKKISLKEKKRRQSQANPNELYKTGAGDYFTMTKVKNGYKIN